MNSRERVFRALQFKPLDRAPRDIWHLPWIDMFASDQLQALQVDLPPDLTSPPAVLGQGHRTEGQQAKKGTYIDEWGCLWEAGEDGVVGEVKSPPLADFSALSTYQPPWEIFDNADWNAVNHAQQQNLSSENPRFMLVRTGVRPFERMQFLRGSESLFMDLAYGSVEVRRLLEMVHTFFLKEIQAWSKTDVDAISFMDDWGSQTSLLISPQMWREYFKPLYKDYCDIIRSAGKKVFMHSDGHISSIYQDLIEIGIDAINSQLFCMDIEDIGRQFKGKITFWGEIDRQNILPFGSVDDVYKAVARVRRALDDGQGGLIAQCEWGPNNPVRNIRAVFEAWNTPLDQLP